MKTMSQTWSRSLAALALLTSLQEVTHAASAANGLRSDKPVAIAARVQDGQRLYEAGNLDATESILKEAASRAPDNGNVSYYLTLLQERRYAQGEKDPNRTQTAPARVAEKPATPEPAPAPAASNPETKPVPEKPGATDDENYRRYNRLMMERYGLIPRGAPLNQNEGNPISARLEKIVLNEVMFDGVPLPEVLKLLDEESRKRDPEKHGINFLINPNGTPGGAIQTIDPNTGQPTSLPPTEPLDMSSVIIRFNLPLRNVRLKDVLDAVVKVADKPIEYSVEDYGLVFSAAPNPSAGSGSALRGKALEAAPLQVRTFRVDTNNFLAGLKRAFGTGSELKENATPDQIRSVLVDVFTRLGINMDLPGKTVFYNDLTGIVMVRATFDDLEIVRAAIETLGGAGSEEAGAQNSAKDGAGPIKYNADMMRRYGLPPSKK